MLVTDIHSDFVSIILAGPAPAVSMEQELSHDRSAEPLAMSFDPRAQIPPQGYL